MQLKTLDGKALRIADPEARRDDAWICAADEEAWHIVREALMGLNFQ